MSVLRLTKVCKRFTSGNEIITILNNIECGVIKTQ